MNKTLNVVFSPTFLILLFSKLQFSGAKHRNEICHTANEMAAP
jgi:hypothetical protein